MTSQRISSLTPMFLLCIISSPTFVHTQLSAIITYEYYTSVSNYQNITENNQTNGLISSSGSRLGVRNRSAFTLVDANGASDACQTPVNTVNYSNGVAILQRGGNCTFSVKITRAKQFGASAVIIYDPQNNGLDLFDMSQNNSDILSLYVQRSIGSILFNLVSNKRSQLNITLEPINDYSVSSSSSSWYGSRSATIFISISICVLFSLCLSWLIFYYCQRYRSRTSKDHLQNRLKNAAKKALAKIPLVTITQTPSTEESCVICLDAIKAGDVVRHLMCDHRFHQHCVDPWLLSHRHCPLCNLDILAAYRISVPGMSEHYQSTAPTSLQPISYASLATTSAMPIVEPDPLRRDQQQQTIIQMQFQPIPSISGSLKEEGEPNPSSRPDHDEH